MAWNPIEHKWLKEDQEKQFEMLNKIILEDKGDVNFSLELLMK